MNAILIKIFATALAFSQVTTRPETVKTEFDPVHDQAEVAQLLSDGCARMRKTFDIEAINLDDLIATAMQDKEALSGEVKALRGLSIADLYAAYRQFCKNERVENSPVDLGQVIAFYNEAVKDLPDPSRLKGGKLPGMSEILDLKGERFAEVHTPESRRVFVPLANVPEVVRRAFVAAEDKRFYEHQGLDERGLVRAFIGNLAQPGRPQGGSTITQQVAKNVLVGNDVTYERKLREMIVASRMERILSKDEILELYLNSIYFGRGAWGIELAARSWFGKGARELDVAEGALLAGLAKGPNYFNPERHPERARDRLDYVLGRMKDDGVIDARQAKAALPQIAAYDRPRRDTGFHLVDQLVREAKAVAGLDPFTATSHTIRSTVNPALQRAVEATLQEGLARYELNTGRYRFQGAETNLAEEVQKLAADSKVTDPAWLAALRRARLPLYDVHWEPAVIVANARGRRGDVLSVGLADGRELPLTAWSAKIRRALKPYDVVYVQVREAKGRQAARAELRVRPTVQGAAVVLENRTGRILAMAGGFSYPLSQLNRATQSQRQPGSTFKPLTYLAALRNGLQPNTLVQDDYISLPPIGATGYERQSDYWTPRNYDGGAAGPITLRRALENSRNLATANLLANGVDLGGAEFGLDRVCDLAMEAQLYKECMRYYPFVLGAQPVRVLDLAAFYSAVASEGARATPHLIESIAQGDREVYRRDPNQVAWIGSADRASFHQLKSILQGVLARGTARMARHLAPFAGGKTGTSQDEVDAWFVGFTNEVTVALWVGYDNAEGRRTLGRGQTGGKVALPMFEPILEAVWALHAPKTALNGPSPEAARQLIAMQVDPYSGDPVQAGAGRAITEYFKRDSTGGIDDTRYRMVSRGDIHGYDDFNRDEDSSIFGRWSSEHRLYDNRGFLPPPFWPFQRQPSWQRAPEDDERYLGQPRRVDPDYLFGRRVY
ncbi:MAG: transglycosylase domain-containing protein [Xanthobacteraceae bacterium]|nr:transglycosylase domain-containing protein [Xanthobacteraceae bacterium]